MQSEDTRNEQRDSLQNLSMEVSRERVESLWRQAIARRSSSRSDLTAAKASRARAEVERQRTSHQALESTRDACRTLIAEAERQLVMARQAEAGAEKKLAEAEQQLKQAEIIRSEAESYRTKAMAEAEQQAHQIREEARSAALQECEELKQHVTYEVQCILNEIDTIREAALEEMEAQRIYTDVANMKVISEDVQTQIMEKVDMTLSQGNGSNGDGHHWGETESWKVMSVGEHHSSEPAAEPVENMADGHHEVGMPSEQVDGAVAPKNSKSKNSK